MKFSWQITIPTRKTWSKLLEQSNLHMA